jgi:hypothetical protein
MSGVSDFYVDPILASPLNLVADEELGTSDTEVVEMSDHSELPDESGSLKRKPDDEDDDGDYPATLLSKRTKPESEKLMFTPDVLPLDIINLVVDHFRDYEGVNEYDESHAFSPFLGNAKSGAYKQSMDYKFIARMMALRSLNRRWCFFITNEFPFWSPIGEVVLYSRMAWITAGSENPETVSNSFPSNVLDFLDENLLKTNETIHELPKYILSLCIKTKQDLIAT